MAQAIPRQDTNGQQLPVYRAASFTVVNGANHGDELSFAAELMLDDIYELTEGAIPSALAFDALPDSAFRISDLSSVGRPGATLHLDCCVTLMPPNGETVEAIILVEVDTRGNIRDIYLHPLAPIAPKTAYSLVGIDRDHARRRMALIGCVSFTRGTRITTATGEQKPIENLQVGDRVLTRDSGVQEIRWVGRSTVRATGPFAPIVIKAGAMNNMGDLKVNPDHRLFVYQREDTVGAGQAEILVKARYLVNGETVYFQEGGFIEYFQLLFDDHEIIFAEGIAAETMMVNQATHPVLPKSLGEKFARSQPGLPNVDTIAYDVKEALLRHRDAAALLRRASSR